MATQLSTDISCVTAEVFSQPGPADCHSYSHHLATDSLKWALYAAVFEGLSKSTNAAARAVMGTYCAHMLPYLCGLHSYQLPSRC